MPHQWHFEAYLIFLLTILLLKYFLQTHRGARGFSDFYTRSGLHRNVPEALLQNNNVNRSLFDLKPGALFSSCVRYVRAGNFFQYKPVSSALNIIAGV